MVLSNCETNDWRLARARILDKLSQIQACRAALFAVDLERCGDLVGN